MLLPLGAALNNQALVLEGSGDTKSKLQAAGKAHGGSRETGGEPSLPAGCWAGNYQVIH